MLFASATRSPAITVIRDWKVIAVRTKRLAGRACSATPSGNWTSTSEFAGATGFLRRVDHFVQRARRRRDHGGRDRAFDKGRVDQPHALAGAVALALEQVADGQDRAAEIAEDDHAVALLGAFDGGL